MARYFAPYLRGQGRALTTGFAALFAGVGFRLLEPWPLKFVFDRAFASGEPRHGALEILIIAAGATLLFTTLRAAAEYFNKTGFTMLGNQILNRVRHDVYRHVQSLSLSFHSRSRSGDLMLRVMGDINMLRDVVVTAFLPLIASVVILAGIVVVMLFMDWRLTLASMCTLPLFVFIAGTLSTRIRSAARNQRKREGELASTAAESISAIKVVQALSLESQFAESFRATNEKSGSQDVKSVQLSARLERSVDVLIAISTAIIIVYGGMRVVSGLITPGDLLVFLTYLRRAFNPVQDFAKYTGRLAKATAAGERVADLLNEKSEVTDSPSAITAPAFEGGILFDRVTFGYPGAAPVLRDITLRISPGQRVAVVGPSGSGKSTLAALVLRLYDPHAGAVRIDGRDIREYTIASIRGQISVVLQETILFAASVWDNVSAAAPSATREEIIAAVQLANAADFIERLPDQYDTIFGERGATLSGGERQRVAIARAAIRNAPILLFDEPTTGLDESNASIVSEALERLSRGRTTLLVTHDLSVAARADHIAYLQNGTIAEFGTHSELMARGGLYAQSYTTQQQRANGGNLDDGR